MYAMLGTRPDIAYTIGVLSQYSASPGKEHVNAVNRVLRYLNATKDYALTFVGNSKQDDFSIYSDSDWVGDQRDHRSISGYVYNMAGAAVSWSSKKQPSTALSSTEGFLTNIRFPPPASTKILGDNQGALALAVNPSYHARTKHIRVRHHFVRECVDIGNVQLEYVPTNDQVADILTKELPEVKHEKFRKMMGVFAVSARREGVLEFDGN